MKNDPAFLEAALVGYESQLSQIDEAIAEVRRRLGRGKAAPSPGKNSGGKHRLSAAARKRIADAQKRRWAAYHKGKSKS